jgi:hypothetical protein
MGKLLIFSANQSTLTDNEEFNDSVDDINLFNDVYQNQFKPFIEYVDLNIHDPITYITTRNDIGYFYLLLEDPKYVKIVNRTDHENYLTCEYKYLKDFLMEDLSGRFDFMPYNKTDVYTIY